MTSKYSGLQLSDRAQPKPMWNNYFSGRPSRNLPPRNYNEQSSDEEEHFQSPGRPPVTREGSPVELAVPQLNDNVDEELDQVKQVLQNVCILYINPETEKPGKIHRKHNKVPKFEPKQ